MRKKLNLQTICHSLQVVQAHNCSSGGLQTRQSGSLEGPDDPLHEAKGPQPHLRPDVPRGGRVLVHASDSRQFSVGLHSLKILLCNDDDDDEDDDDDDVVVVVDDDDDDYDYD